MLTRGEDAEARSIEGSFLLLVEGVDEKHVLKKMIEMPVRGQIIPAGGRRVFRRRLEAINVQSKKKVYRDKLNLSSILDNPQKNDRNAD